MSEGWRRLAAAREQEIREHWLPQVAKLEADVRLWRRARDWQHGRAESWKSRALAAEAQLTEMEAP